MLREFKLPDVGEGLPDAEIVKWHVAPGDPVRVNQIIVDIETAKAVVELPCPFEGTVSELLAVEGQTVDVGTPIITVRTPEDGPTPPTGTAPAAAAEQAPGAPPRHPDESDHPAERQPVLVGYGVKASATKRRRRTSPPGPVATAPAGRAPAGVVSPGATVPAGTVPPAATPPAGTVPPAGAIAGRPRVLAKPPVRKLARDLGVDLATITGSGPGGAITRADVEAVASTMSVTGVSPAVWSAPAPAAGAVPEREERIPVRGVRRATAQATAASAFSAPHVTEFLQVDATEMMNAVGRLRCLPEFAGVKVTPLLLVAKALLTAVRQYPMVNASWAGEEIIVKHYVNLGIAAATTRGLIVPTIKDAHTLRLPELARALTELTERARAGTCTPAELTGGTITITNVGVFGVDAGTPILPPGEVAILALGQIRDMPWVVNGQLAVRKVTTLALSFDHRVVDGELGSRVLRAVGDMVEDPLRMLVWA